MDEWWGGNEKKKKNTVEAPYNAVIGRHISHLSYNLTGVYQNGVEEMIENDENTKPAL